MKIRTLAVVCCLVLAGCAAPTPSYSGDAGAPPGPYGPGTDQLGWENGYWYNDTIAVNQSDGLNESELTAFVARTMARVERIRGAEFEEAVPVEIITRAEYRNRSGTRDTTVDTSQELAREQLWEAPLLIGEDRTVGAAFGGLYGSSVLGFYSPSQNRIVIVSESETPQIDRVTLAHELVHALQDQQFSLLPGADSHDEDIARTGVVEGDASYVEQRYEERCAENWRCVERPNRTAGGGLADENLGAYVAIYSPYSDGPSFVHQIHQRGGWKAVNNLYEQPPTSSEQLIHPASYPDDSPEQVRIPDRSGERWDRYGARERVGESTLFAMFWFQRGVNRSTLSQETAPYSRYNYVSSVTDGWAGDRLVTYRNGDANGYIWRLRWETRSDAREFTRAYRRMLVERLDATVVRPGVYQITDGPFEDAFRIRRDGRTVTIVNAPRVQALKNVHPRQD